MPKVKDMSVQELRELMGNVVEEKLRDLLGDPDEGLELRPEVRERLLDSLHHPRSSRQTVSADEVARRLGFKK